MIIDNLVRRGLAIISVQAEKPELIRASADVVVPLREGQCYDLGGGWEYEAEADILLLCHHNAYVNTGLQNALNREFGLGGTAVGFIGVDNNTTAVTASTVYLHGSAGATAANQIIKAISPAASLAAQTVTAGATFANADFTSGVFVMNKIGLLTTSTDAGTGLVDVIGGTGGSSPYNRTFSLDLTAAGTFTTVPQIAVTAQAA